MSAIPDAIRQLLDELEANRKSRRTAWVTLQRLRKFLEENGARIGTPDDRSFETEGEAIESGFRRTIAGRDTVIVCSFVALLLIGFSFGRKCVESRVLEKLQGVRRDLQKIEQENPTETTKGALWAILEIEEDLLVNRERIYRDWSYPGMLRSEPLDPRQQSK